MDWQKNYATPIAQRRSAVAIAALILAAGSPGAALAKDVVPEEVWYAYAQIRLRADNATTYLFYNLGAMSHEATEECLNSEVAIYVDMPKCAARNGDELAAECTKASGLKRDLLSRLQEKRAEQPEIPEMDIDIECRASRYNYEFSKVSVAEAALALVRRSLPDRGVISDQDTVLDGHFYHWTLEKCRPTQRGKRRRQECVHALQDIKTSGGKGPYLTRAQREQRLKIIAEQAEKARIEGVRASARITGAFDLEFGTPASVPWKPADVNAMIDLPLAPPVYQDNRRGWVYFVPRTPPEVFADLANVKYLALLRSEYVPINISVTGRVQGSCDEFKRAIDDALASKYGRGAETSVFTDGANSVITKCHLGLFSISYIDTAGYKLHNEELESEAAESRQGITDAAKKGL